MSRHFPWYAARPSGVSSLNSSIASGSSQFRALFCVQHRGRVKVARGRSRRRVDAPPVVPLRRRAPVWRAGRALRVSNYLARQLVVG